VHIYPVVILYAAILKLGGIVAEGCVAGRRKTFPALNEPDQSISKFQVFDVGVAAASFQVDESKGEACGKRIAFGIEVFGVCRMRANLP